MIARIRFSHGRFACPYVVKPTVGWVSPVKLSNMFRPVRVTAWEKTTVFKQRSLLSYY